MQTSSISLASFRVKQRKKGTSVCTQANNGLVERISVFIIQQIVTMPIYGKEALNICHPYMTDILRYT